MGRGRGRNVRADQRAAAELREALERAWFHRLREEPALAGLVTARTARQEPYHRWHHYVQGFAPGLVRNFLAEAAPAEGPVVDPFSGSGTVVIECARDGRAAVGIDAVPALAFVTSSRWLGAPPPWPELPETGSFTDLLARAADPRHRAAVLLAAALSVDAEGHGRRLQSAPAELVRTRLAWMAEDHGTPLTRRNLAVAGDARRLPLADASAGGMLTSPPYVGRYDYARVNEPMEALLRGTGRRAARRPQVRAAPALARGRSAAVPPAAEEAARALDAQGDAAVARLVRVYFHDLGSVIAEAARVLRPGAPLWIVVGGSDLKRVYIPTDLILAEAARDLGFRVESVAVARTLRPTGRRLGGLDGVAPRESLLRLRRDQSQA